MKWHTFCENNNSIFTVYLAYIYTYTLIMCNWVVSQLCSQHDIMHVSLEYMASVLSVIYQVFVYYIVCVCVQVIQVINIAAYWANFYFRQHNLMIHLYSDTSIIYVLIPAALYISQHQYHGLYQQKIFQRPHPIPVVFLSLTVWYNTFDKWRSPTDGIADVGGLTVQPYLPEQILSGIITSWYIVTYYITSKSEELFSSFM